MAPRKAKSTAIAKHEHKGSVAAPDYLKNYSGATGTEDIDNEDVTIPRIKLAQGLTPEVKDGKVKDGSLFLNVSGEVLAEPGKPLRFTPVARGKEFILWNPSRGEGILARARRCIVKGVVLYMWDKQNTTFEVKFKQGPKVKWMTKEYVEDNDMHAFGSSVPGDDDSAPAATAHHNYVVALPDYGNMIAALSLSRSQVKRAKDLNALFKLNPAPIFSRVFIVQSKAEKNDEGDFYNYSFAPDGFVEDKADFENYKAIAEGFTERGYTVDQSDEDQSEGNRGGGTSI